jgi:hypothetical protein
VGATGFEHLANLTGKTPNHESSAAESGAVLRQNDPPPAIGSVEALAAQLAKLPPADRQRLAALLLGKADNA